MAQNILDIKEIMFNVDELKKSYRNIEVEFWNLKSPETKQDNPKKSNTNLLSAKPAMSSIQHTSLCLNTNNVPVSLVKIKTTKGNIKLNERREPRKQNKKNLTVRFTSETKQDESTKKNMNIQSAKSVIKSIKHTPPFLTTKPVPLGKTNTKNKNIVTNPPGKFQNKY